MIPIRLCILTCGLTGGGMLLACMWQMPDFAEFLIVGAGEIAALTAIAFILTFGREGK